MSPDMLAQLAAEGDPNGTPPEIPDYLLWIWRAWNRLNRDRNYRGGGMGPAIPAPITWAAVVAWCAFHGYPGDAVADLDGYLQQMDAVYIQWVIDRIPKT